MIISFRHKGLETFYRSASTKGIQADHAPKLARILSALDAASSPEELAPTQGQIEGPLVHLGERQLAGDIRFTTADIELVDYLDYH